MVNRMMNLKRRNVPNVKQVRLKLVQIDFWSAVRMGLMVEIGLGIATIIGFFFLWLVVANTGLFSSLNSLLNSVIGAGGNVDVGAQLSVARVLSFAATISIFNIVLGTLFAGVLALVYNAIARLTGGLSVGFTNE
ncbi:MAG: DUF3566 domain-containing protein [Actinomycetes bacterium]